MDYAQLLGMSGGNSQGAGIMDTALGGGNTGAQLLGAAPARLPGAGFQGFNQTTPVADLLSKYRAQAAAAPAMPQFQPQMPAPAPAPVSVPAPAPAFTQPDLLPQQREALQQIIAQRDPGGVKHNQIQQLLNSGQAYYTSPNTISMGSIMYPQGGTWGVNDG